MPQKTKTKKYVNDIKAILFNENIPQTDKFIPVHIGFSGSLEK